MDARLVPLASEATPSPELCLRVRDLLAAGRPLVLPTETVYAVAVRADLPAELQRALERGRAPSDVPPEVHLPSPPAADTFPELPRLRERLAARYWPGPLTLVLRGQIPGAAAAGRGGWTAVRVPAHGGTRALLEGAGAPVVLVTARDAAGSPLLEAGSVLDALGEEVDLVVDGGPAPLGQESTALRLGLGTFEVLREGIVGPDELRAAAGRRILFVCTGNTCRSPMAEGLARHALARRLGIEAGGRAADEVAALARFGFEVRSAGVHAPPGAPISLHAAEALAERGIDLRQHVSRPALGADLERQDHVYCLTRSHLEALRMALPPGRLPSAELLDPRGRDVPDPIGGPLELYRETAARILEAVEARLDEWA